MPPGGRDLTLRVEGKELSVIDLDFTAEPLARERFVEELAFDHYQRYRLAAEVLETFGEEAKTVLDVGGAYGYLSLFAPKRKVSVLDVVWEDQPEIRNYGGDRLPYADGAFDVVVSVDTLEHIVPEKRESFINELCRAAKEAVILCGPYHEPYVAEAEEVLRNFVQLQLGIRDRFLDEHHQYSLPDRTAVRKILARNGLSVFEIPNGCLPRWLSMQLANYALGISPEWAEGKARFNALYNANYYAQDNSHPAYRILAVATRKPQTAELKRWLGKKISPDNGVSVPTLWNLASLIVTLSQYRIIREKETAIAGQSTQIDRLLGHLQNLETMLLREREHRDDLLRHTENLDTLLRGHEERFLSLEQHGGNLSLLLREQNDNAANYQALSREIQQHNSELQHHIDNLDRIHAEREAFLSQLQGHIGNLDRIHAEREAFLSRLQEHIGNLDKRYEARELFLEEIQKHFQNLEERWRDYDAHHKSLMQHAENLSASLARSEANAEGLRLHSENLQLQIQGQQDHIRRLTDHIANMEQNAQEWKTHTKNLETLLGEREKHISNLGAVEKENQFLRQSLMALTAQLRASPPEPYPPEETCEKLAALLGIPAASSVVEMSKVIQSVARTVLEEKQRNRRAIETVRSSRLYRILARMGLLPSLEESSGE